MRILIFSYALVSFACFGQTQTQKTNFLSSPLSMEAKGDFGTYAVILNKTLPIPKNLNIKYTVGNWSIVLADKQQLGELLVQGYITSISREGGKPVALNDSVRSTHFINQIHAGTGGLPTSYTGKGIILGYVDTGMDYNHGDFKDSNGRTRVIRYWDQQAAFDASRTPSKYGYGQIFDSTDINSGQQPDYSGSGHGTTVAGCGSGNGRANGLNKGMAPETDIIMVRTDFSRPNWTLTVAEGIDYVFAVADSMGMAAVVNVSAGDYLGSHDGKDVAAQYIDSLLDQKPGRLVVCAAGNSGNLGKYHVHGNVDADTSFFWLIPNPSSTFGQPAVYADIWADTSEMKNVHFAFGADAPEPNYRGRTQFHTTFANLSVSDVYDSIYINGNRIGSVDYSESIEGSNYHLELVVFTDSTSYNYRIMTTTSGTGSYDAWSGAGLGLSDIETNLPSVGSFPAIAYYQMPDTLETIISSFACSEKVITVANMQNHASYIDTNGNTYIPTPPVPSGKLSVNSSKGPNRIGEQKPDITAAGDITLSAFNLDEIAYVYANQPDLLGRGGLHARNGGTSMASPIVAGIAALYLEKCNKSTWSDFKADLSAAAFSDAFSGSALPNYAFGYGKAHGLNTLLRTNYSPHIMGDTLICGTSSLTTNPSATIISWNNDSTFDYPLLADSSGYYTAEMTNVKGCKAHTDTIHLILGHLQTASTVTLVDQTILIASSNTNYQWYLNGNLLPGDTNQVLYPTISGIYTVEVTDPSGCDAFSDPVDVGFLEIASNKLSAVKLYPNPATSSLELSGVSTGDLIIYSVSGQLVKQFIIEKGKKYDIGELQTGTYLVKIQSEEGMHYTKLIKF